jgi:hypothetical protein
MGVVSASVVAACRSPRRHSVVGVDTSASYLSVAETFRTEFGRMCVVP